MFKKEKILHTPVLLNRCINLINSAVQNIDNPVILDATLGMGGHTEEILKRIPTAHLICIDRDIDAINIAKERLKKFKNRITIYNGVYSEIPEALRCANKKQLNAVLFDLGVSSFQIDKVSRGFSYSKESPLDMRMDTTKQLTAEYVINNYQFKQLKSIISQYGQERFSHKITKRIIENRINTPYRTSEQLVETIRSVIPVKLGKKNGHPAKRTFQALRIEVNQELDILKKALPIAIKKLTLHGIILTMSYHSLEDSIVKNIFSQGCQSSAPLDLPIELEEHKPYLKFLIKGVELAQDDELKKNPRASSVKLRAVKKIRIIENY